MNTAAPARSNKARSLGFIAVVALVVLLLVIDMRRRAAESQLAQLSIRLEQLGGGDTGNQEQNREAARLIVEQVRKLYELPTDVEPTVATIVDVNQLRSRNTFYNKAKNGDYLIVTQDRALLFDAKANKIIDVVPVQIQPSEPVSSAPTQP
jgi:hypothetical protein